MAECGRIVYDDTHSSIPKVVVFYVKLFALEDHIFLSQPVLRPVYAERLMIWIALRCQSLYHLELTLTVKAIQDRIIFFESARLPVSFGPRYISYGVVRMFGFPKTKEIYPSAISLPR